MYCINPNTPQYQEILKEVGNPLTANEIYRQRYLKDGVDELFESNPELSSMGTQEEYSSYLDTVFPERTLRQIVYHSTVRPFEKYDQSKTTQMSKDMGRGIYFSDLKNALGQWSGYQEESVLRLKAEQEKSITRNGNDLIAFFQDWFKGLPTQEKTYVQTRMNQLREEDMDLSIDPRELYKKIYEEYTGQDITKTGASVEGIDLLDKAKIIPMIINAKNIFYTADAYISRQNKEYAGMGIDTIIEYGEDDNGNVNKNEIYQGVFRNPSEIHILGGEKDMKMFQEYLSNKRVEDKRLTPEKMELLAMARETLSEEEVSIVENILNGDENFTDMSNFTCS